MPRAPASKTFSAAPSARRPLFWEKPHQGRHLRSGSGASRSGRLLRRQRHLAALRDVLSRVSYLVAHQPIAIAILTRGELLDGSDRVAAHLVFPLAKDRGGGRRHPILAAPAQDEGEARRWPGRRARPARRGRAGEGGAGARGWHEARHHRLAALGTPPSAADSPFASTSSGRRPKAGSAAAETEPRGGSTEARARGDGESDPARRFMLLARCRPSQQRFRSRECRCGIPDIERVVSFQRATTPWS